MRYYVEFFDTVTERRAVFKMPYPKFETVEEYKIWAQSMVNKRHLLGAKMIRHNSHDWQLECMEFFCEYYYIHRSHPSHYNKEFLELMREFLK